MGVFFYFTSSLNRKQTPHQDNDGENAGDGGGRERHSVSTAIVTRFPHAGNEVSGQAKSRLTSFSPLNTLERRAGSKLGH
jgi:hypothetical protein